MDLVNVVSEAAARSFVPSLFLCTNADPARFCADGDFLPDEAGPGTERSY